MALLEINNLQVKVGNEILKGVNLTLNVAKSTPSWGPNGSGKSTLARALSGPDVYEVTGGRCRSREGSARLSTGRTRPR